MGLALALNTALTGLQVNQKTMALISNNIANANTEGYSRQIVDLESVTFDGVGGGVRIKQITRKVDEYLQASVNDQTSVLGRSDVISSYYDSIQTLLGDPSLGNSIDKHIDTFFSDLQQMAETPERSSTRAAVVESAITMSREISNLALGLEELRFQADNEISNATQTLNQKIKELYSVNESIAEADSMGSSTATLLDHRDMLLEDISEYIDINANERANGSVDVYAGNGLNLIDIGYSELTYSEISSLGVLTDNQEINPIVLQSLSSSGTSIGNPTNLVSGGTSSEIESRFSDGRLSGLLEIRDTIIPNMLEQLDQISSEIRDSFNAIHNQGSGYPAANELTGTALYDVAERSQWEGSVMIAALNEDGTPATNPFNDEANSFRPLTLELDSLYSGQGFGEPDVQTIIDEINNHFGVPQNRMSFGNLNNVQLAMVSDSVGAAPTIDFDFDIDNISGQSGEFWIDSIQVLDDTAADITSTTNTIPTIALSPTATFNTTAASTTVTVTSALNHGLSNGDMVKLNNPGGPVNGIPAADFDNYFVISNVTAGSFEITVANPAVGTGNVGVAAQTISPPYDTIAPGEKTRLQQNGTITADLSGNLSSNYYDINVAMRVRDEDGTISTTTATYRVLNSQTDTMNDRISARAITAGSGTVTVPDDYTPFLHASMVDEDGIELGNTSGYYGDQRGYLKIESLRDGVTFAIDDISSKHMGLPSDTPARAGDDRGFAHHFGLNNFFSNNSLTETGDTVKNSAINLAVEQRLHDESSLISTGNLQRSNQPTSSSAFPVYTYERFSGDHSIAQQLAALGINTQNFTEAGGLPSSSLTFSAYAGEMLGYISANSISAESKANNDSTLLDGYLERADAVSGVNLDEELANTIVYQNAYSASARVISITDELFKTLLQAF